MGPSSPALYFLPQVEFKLELTQVRVMATVDKEKLASSSSLSLFLYYSGEEGKEVEKGIY